MIAGYTHCVFRHVFRRGEVTEVWSFEVFGGKKKKLFRKKVKNLSKLPHLTA